LVLKAGKMY